MKTKKGILFLGVFLCVLVSPIGGAMDRYIVEQYGAMFNTLTEPEKSWIMAFYDNTNYTKMKQASQFLLTAQSLSEKAEMAIIKGVLNPGTRGKALHILAHRENLSPEAEKFVARLLYTSLRGDAVGVLLVRSKKVEGLSLYQLTQEELLSILSEKRGNPAIRDASFRVLRTIKIHQSIQEQLVTMLDGPFHRYAQALLLNAHLVESTQEKLKGLLLHHKNIRVQQMAEHIFRKRSLNQTFSNSIKEDLYWLPIHNGDPCSKAFSG